MTSFSEPETEWVFCPGCAKPVIVHEECVTDVFVYGPFGSQQLDENVEHECND